MQECDVFSRSCSCRRSFARIHFQPVHELVVIVQTFTIISLSSGFTLYCSIVGCKNPQRATKPHSSIHRASDPIGQSSLICQLSFLGNFRIFIHNWPHTFLWETSGWPKALQSSLMPSKGNCQPGALRTNVGGSGTEGWCSQGRLFVKAALAASQPQKQAYQVTWGPWRLQRIPDPLY